jgi:uncharacterized membrane protein YesL
MNKKLFDVIDKVYKLFMASLYFWGYAFKGLLVYGIFPSLCSFVYVIHGVHDFIIHQLFCCVSEYDNRACF